MPTLILPYRHKPDFTVMWQTAMKLGWQTVRWPLRPPFPELKGEVVLYADPLTSSILRQETGFGFPEAPLDWLTRIPYDYLKRRVVFGSLGERETLTAGWKGPWFIKPAKVKTFAATIYHSLDEPAFRELEQDTEILISSPMTFSQEWRFFIGDRAIRACSIYARNGEPFEDAWRWEEDEERQALEYMRAMLADSRVPVLASQVIDIGMYNDGWAVIESNDAYASGFYGCDPEGVLHALLASAQIF